MNEKAGNREYYIKAVELKDEIVLITLGDKKDKKWSITVHSNGEDIASTFSNISPPGEYKQVICRYAKECKDKNCRHRVLHDQGLWGSDCHAHWCNGDPKKEATRGCCITPEVKEEQDIRHWHNVEGEHTYL